MMADGSRGGIDCGAGVPPPSGNGGDGGGQRRYIGGHGSSDGSGGGNSSGGNGDNGDRGVDIGGGDDGYTLVAGGSDPPPNWVVEEQDSRNYAKDGGGPLAGTFGTSQGFSAEDSIIFPTLGLGLHVLPHPSRHRHALLVFSKRRNDGAQWWVSDSGASVHGTGSSMDHLYTTRPPTPEESRLVVGTGEVMQVRCIGDLDMVLHCDEDVVVTLRGVSFVSACGTSSCPSISSRKRRILS